MTVIHNYMNTSEWLATMFASNDKQYGFYKTVFDHIEKTGKFFPTDAKEWDERSRRRWLAKLYEGTKTTTGIEVIERKRAGWQGQVYYRLNPMFKGNLNKLWKWIKKIEQGR